MKSPRRITFAAVAAVVAFLATGCGTVSGTPAAGELDVRKLDAGKYSMEPNDVRFKYQPTMEYGQQLAIMRLADSVANGIDIDPKLDYGSAGGMDKPGDFTTSVVRASFEPVMNQYGMLYGFQGASADHPDVDTVQKGDKYVSILALQFPDSTTAEAAAKGLEEADFNIARDQNQPVQLAKYPTALAHWRPGIRTLGSRIARGSYVLDIFVRTPNPELTDLTALAERVYDVQLPLLDALKPLSKREILRLPYDPDGMLRRTFTPKTLYGPQIPISMVVSSHAYLNFSNAGAKSQKSDFEASGIDLVSTMERATFLMRARDSAGAKSFADKSRGKVTQPVDPPPNVPDAFCNEKTTAASTDSTASDQRFRCVVHYGRYIGVVTSAQLTDAQQRAAAQYAMLANSW
ncbi:hypothetical protein DFR76_108302 [Nocardia pseudobrasiliensis]|uniref:Uncharacterized protein n=1 Tax=Nocardia pseudobrasiliensis TaxID=45979 RepID=A0A370I162_9NOCA|nr:hypothetical protein DFR76_108302 [Nocardia pseudobrasiliensis]